ncbi:hypothetical protein [Mycobacterium sp. PSTR-4-N]|uniref:hypothetical protein n=1 Tax=Mycobacterium sp. PSTR-4-N TaxID=2917745 RepID=UPI001F14E3C4|nr:hypothetical protein [Mycobacterium sp. PSTR-4-N]MCG7596368.1 hypothetical protein [Mycobacterium sp. PSTR-4-N]
MTAETGDWEPTLEAIHQVPGKTKQQPAKKTWQDRIEDAKFQRRRYNADVAVGLGMFDDGERDPLEWLSGWSTDLSVTLTEHTEAIATLNEIAAATNATAAYVSDIDAMATVARASVVTTGIASGSTKPRYADVIDIDEGDHREDTAGYLWQGVLPTIVPRTPKGSSIGHIYFAPIVVDRSGTVDIFRWLTGADTSIFSIDYYEVALFIYDPATANLVKVWGSGNIKDTYANIGSTSAPPAEVAITMTIAGVPIAQQCSPGQILFAAIQQTAPGLLQTPRRFGVAPMPTIGRTVPILDAACYIAKDYSQGIPSSISFASLSRETRFIPWASVSVLTGEEAA